MSNPWTISHRAHLPARLLADRHYNRQKVGSPGFVPPGRCVVLLLESHDAVWVTSWPFAQYVRHAWAGAWVNSLFRNESPHLSSWLVQQAILKTLEVWPEPPELGMITFVDAGKIRKKRDPGRCYRKAGFSHVGFTKGGLYALQLLPKEIHDLQLQPHEIRRFSVAEFKGLKITQAITEFGEGVPSTRVTEGNYLLELDSLVGSMTNDGDPFISFRTKIVAGPIGMNQEGAGLPVWTMCSFAEKREWATGQMLAAVGIDVKALVNVELPAGDAGFEKFKAICVALGKQVQGRKFGATLTDYTGGKVVTSQIQRPFSQVEFEAQQAAAASRPVAQAPVPTNGKAAEPVSDDALQGQLEALLTGSSTPATV